MKEKRILALAFIFPFLIAVISMLFVIFNINLALSEAIYQLVLMVALLSFFIAIVFLRRFLVEIRYDIDERKDNEKNVRDCYLYHQLLNPPELNN